MDDLELDAIMKRAANEPHYTNAWSLETMHAARVDRHALVNEVRRLRKLLEPAPTTQREEA